MSKAITHPPYSSAPAAIVTPSVRGAGPPVAQRTERAGHRAASDRGQRRIAKFRPMCAAGGGEGEQRDETRRHGAGLRERELRRPSGRRPGEKNVGRASDGGRRDHRRRLFAI